MNYNINLPAEILGKIFSYLPNKKPDHNRSNLCLVCKSWYNAAVYYYGSFARVSLDDGSLRSLNEYIKMNPGFAFKIKWLTLTHNEKAAVDEQEITHQFIQLLASCLNLTELNMRISPHINLLLSGMLENMAQVPRLHRINYLSKPHTSFKTNQLLEQLMMRLKSSLTRLHIRNNNNAFMEMGGIAGYITQAPCLRHLEIVAVSKNWIAPKHETQLPSLFSSNQQLESVKILNCGGTTRAMISRKAIDLSDTAPNYILECLELETSTVDISNLQYIMTKFKRLKHLKIKINDRVTVDLHTDATAVNHVLYQFRQFCREIDSVNVFFPCDLTRDRFYIYRNTKEEYGLIKQMMQSSAFTF